MEITALDNDWKIYWNWHNLNYYIPVALNRCAHRSSNCGLLSPQQFSLLTISIQKVIRTRGHPSRAAFRPRKRNVQPSKARRFELLCPQQLPLKLEQNARRFGTGISIFVLIRDSMQKSVKRSIPFMAWEFDHDYGITKTKTKRYYW